MKEKKIVLLISFFSFGCSNVGEKNLKNVKLIKVDMTPMEVKNIMGIPKDTFTQYNLRYYYEVPFGYSDDIRITFDTITHRVRTIDEGSKY